MDTNHITTTRFAAAQSSETLARQEENNFKVPTVQEFGQVSKEVIKALTEKSKKLCTKTNND